MFEAIHGFLLDFDSGEQLRLAVQRAAELEHLAIDDLPLVVRRLELPETTGDLGEPERPSIAISAWSNAMPDARRKARASA